MQFTVKQMTDFAESFEAGWFPFLLEMFAKSCAIGDKALPIDTSRVYWITINLLDVGRQMGMEEASAGSEWLQRNTIWTMLRNGEKFAEFHDNDICQFARVWFRGSALVDCEHEIPIEATVGMNPDFLPALIEYGNQLSQK